MANREALESLEPLNPLTPDPDFGNLFCVFWQAKGKVQFLVSPCQALPAGSYREMAIWRVHCCSSLLVNSNVPNISTVYLSGQAIGECQYGSAAEFSWGRRVQFSKICTRRKRAVSDVTDTK